MEGKKAQGLSITTIILIILGVIVLVMLIVGFTKGWSGIKDWIAPSNNVQQIVSQCEIACAAGGKYDFCFAKRDLKSEDENLKDVSCYTLNKVKSQYGVAACSAISCGIYDSESEAKKFCVDGKKADTEKVSYIEEDKTEKTLKVIEKTCGDLK